MEAAIPLGSGTPAPHDIRSRFRQAVRSGHHHWLWPDVALEDWRLALGQIEGAMRAVLNEDDIPLPLSGSPAAMGIAGYTSGMGPLISYWIEHGVLRASHAITQQLALHLAHNRARMAAMESRAEHVVTTLAAAGFEPAMLKGIDSAFRYFPEPGVRPVSDIDILVRPSESRAVGEILRKLGFETGEGHLPRQTWHPTDGPREPMTLAFLHRDDPWSVDLHMSLDRSYAPGTPSIRLDAEVASDRFGAWKPNPRARVLDQPVALLNLMVHAACPLLHLTMLRLMETVLVIRKERADGRLDWDEFRAAAERARALGTIYVVVRLVEELAPGTIAPVILNACQQAAPIRVRRLVDTMTPAHVQGIGRFSIAERLMWCGSAGAIWRQVLAELWPDSAPISCRLRTAHLRMSQLFGMALAT